VVAVLQGGACAACIGQNDPTAFRDTHDGDLKVVEAVGFNFRITSYNKSQTWEVYGVWDVNCVATVDFNVPGKPNPPPVNLKMTMYVMQSTDEHLSRLGFEFTDPTSTLAPPTQPLNFWVLEKWPKPQPARSTIDMKAKTCIDTPLFRSLVVNDMHDGDEKALKVKGNALHITPYNNKQSWNVDATFGDDCVASVNFNVKGKPNPPPVPLDAQVWGMVSIAGLDKVAVLFSDPSGTIASEHITLNAWVPSNDKKVNADATPASFHV